MERQMSERAREQWLAILEAAVRGNEAKLDELVSQGVNLDLQLKLELGSASALHVLAIRGNIPAIELLIRKGASIDMGAGEDARTALHFAAVCGHANLVQILMALGANVYARTSGQPHGNSNIPLHSVATSGRDDRSSVQILRHLLTHDSGVSHLLIDDADGDTALHCAAFNKTIPHILISEILSILSTASFLSAPSVINRGNHRGQTPLHYAVCNPLAADLLLKAGASKDACDAYGATPFHYAARSGNVCVLDMLNVENQLDLDAPATINHFRALHYAAWNQRHKAVDWLLEHGASVNVTDTYKGDTPLHLAARRGDAEVIRTLIIKGSADILAPNKNGELALGLADDRGHHEAAEAFVKAIREKNSEDSVKELGTKHSSNGASLLHYFAAYAGTEEDMEWILKVIKHNKLNTTVKVDEERPVNARDNTNRTAVHWAAMKGNKHALRILAQNKATLNAEMNDGGRDGFPKTPLYLALRNEKIAFADELMNLKSDVHGQDWLLGIRRRCLMSYYEQDVKLQEKLVSLRAELEKHKYPPNISNDTDLLSEIPSVYLALYAEREDVASFFQRHSKVGDDAVNERGKQSGRTSLHWATLLRQRKIVAQLCRSKHFKDDLTANVEDKCGKTALQYAKEMGGDGMENEIGKDIEKELMQRSDVRAHIDGLHKDRQVYVDAANAILVGAALIAGVTFAGWLQPPLGYTNYYNLPANVPAGQPDTIFQTYAAIQQHAAAGFAVLPPVFKYQAIMLVTTIIGAMPCVFLFIWFWGRLTLLCPVRKSMWKIISLGSSTASRNTCRLCETLETELVSGEIVVDLISPAPSTSRREQIEASIEDDDYKVGKNYDEYFWDDGLNVPADL